MTRISAVTRCKFRVEQIPPHIVGALERLASRNIDLVPIPGLERYFVLAREGFASLVERTSQGFGRAGTPGLVTERGFAALIWREDVPWFVGKGFEFRAGPEQVASIRRFTADLELALAGEP